jgi:hypothetical protein
VARQVDRRTHRGKYVRIMRHNAAIVEQDNRIIGMNYLLIKECVSISICAKLFFIIAIDELRKMDDSR